MRCVKNIQSTVMVLAIHLITIMSQEVRIPGQRLMDLLTGITRTSRDVIVDTMGRVREIIPESPLVHPDDTVIYELLEYIKIKMKYSHPKLEVPILDPFVSNEIAFSIINEIVGNISFSLEEINITKASQFETNKVKMQWVPPKLGVSVVFPEIRAHCGYNISGLLGNMIPIHGEGPARLSIKNLNSNVTVHLGTHNTSLYIKSLDLNYTIEEIHVNFTNLMGGGRFGELLNKVLSQEGPQILELIRTDLIDVTSQWLHGAGNGVLGRLSISIPGVIDFLKTMGTKKVRSIFNFKTLRFNI